MEKCWYHMALDDPCPNEAKWKSGPQYTGKRGVALSFVLAVRWCDEHKHEEDVPILPQENR